MVVFVCDACGEVVKKPKAEQHARSCRGFRGYVCQDCMKTFTGDSYKAHTQCISEAQRYQGALYRPPKQQQKQKPKPQQQQPKPTTTEKRPREEEAAASVQATTPAPEEEETLPKKKQHRKKVSAELLAAVTAEVDKAAVNAASDEDLLRATVQRRLERALDRALEARRKQQQ